MTMKYIRTGPQWWHPWAWGAYCVVLLVVLPMSLAIYMVSP